MVFSLEKSTTFITTLKGKEGNREFMHKKGPRVLSSNCNPLLMTIKMNHTSIIKIQTPRCYIK